MVKKITPLVGSLCCKPGERLHGVFISSETASNQPDAENIVFYNFGEAPFAGAGSALAGLQRADGLEPDIVSKLLRRRWARPIDEPTLMRLVAAAAPAPVLPRAPFNRNGLDPCDELCVAGIARIASSDAPAVLEGTVFRVGAGGFEPP